MNQQLVVQRRSSNSLNLVSCFFKDTWIHGYIPPTAPPTASPAGPRIKAQILAILPVIRPPFRDCLYTANQEIQTDKVFLMGPKSIQTNFSPGLQIKNRHQMKNRPPPKKKEDSTTSQKHLNRERMQMKGM